MKNKNRNLETIMKKQMRRETVVDDGKSTVR
jgi:hypothetical protein